MAQARLSRRLGPVVGDPPAPGSLGVGIGIGIGIDSFRVSQKLQCHRNDRPSRHYAIDLQYITFLVFKSHLLSFDSDSDTDPDPDYNPYRDRDAFALEKMSKRQRQAHNGDR
jgi:hypothetical protein